MTIYPSVSSLEIISFLVFQFRFCVVNTFGYHRAMSSHWQDWKIEKTKRPLIQRLKIADRSKLNWNWESKTARSVLEIVCTRNGHVREHTTSGASDMQPLVSRMQMRLARLRAVDKCVCTWIYYLYTCIAENSKVDAEALPRPFSPLISRIFFFFFSFYYEFKRSDELLTKLFQGSFPV